MRALDIHGGSVLPGIAVETDPSPRVVLGGRFCQSTHVALGWEDAERLLAGRRLVPCPNRGQVEEKTYYYKQFSPSRQCGQCGISYSSWVNQRRPGLATWTRDHPMDGCVEISVVTDAGVMPLYGRDGKPNGRYLLVKPDPRIEDDSRTLVCWRFPSGDFGASRIVAPQGVRVVAQGVRRLEGPRFGEVAEMMAILKPGQELRAHRSGSCTHAALRWDGGKTLCPYRRFGGLWRHRNQTGGTRGFLSACPCFPCRGKFGFMTSCRARFAPAFFVP